MKRTHLGSEDMCLITLKSKNLNLWYGLQLFWDLSLNSITVLQKNNKKSSVYFFISLSLSDVGVSHEFFHKTENKM